MDAVPAEHGVHAVVADELGDRLHLVRRAVVRSNRLVRRARADDVDHAEHADVAHGPDRRVLGHQPLVVAAHHLAHSGGALDQPVLLVDRDRGQRRRATHRVRVVGQAAEEDLVAERLGDRAAHADRAERQVRRGQALGHRDQVRDDAPVVDRPPLAGAAEACHDLIGDEPDAVAIAHLANALQVAVGRDEDAVGPDHGLEDERGYRLRALIEDHPLRLAQQLVDRPWPGLAPRLRVGHADHAPDAVLGCPAARVAGGRDDLARGAVIRPIARQHLPATGRLARELDGVLVGLGTAVGEEEDVDVAGRELGQLLAQPSARLVGHERIHVRELVGLGLDGIDHALVAVADVDAHQLRVEVEVALAVGRVEIRALSPINGNGIGGGLGRPLIQRVLARQLDDLVGRHPRQL